MSLPIITLVGNLGKDAEVLKLPSGTEVTKFSLCVNYSKTESAWFDGAIFGQRGPKLASYLKKGTKVVCSGTLKTTEKNGKTYLNVNVSEIDLCGSPVKAEQTAGPAYVDGGQAKHTIPDEVDNIPF